jgi:hypothetical protein
MQEDDEGFEYPIVRSEFCINCNLCRQVCPIINKRKSSCPPKPVKSFAIQNINISFLKDSTSGGFFTALSKFVIEKKGIVFGAVFNDKLDVVHDSVFSPEEISVFRGSKYVQSKIGNAYLEIENYLRRGRLVCFSGTPCQIEGLKAYLRKSYDNLICCDVVCRGVPSPKIFRAYRKYLECKYKSPLGRIKFRDKYYGYLYSTTAFTFQNDFTIRFGPENDFLHKIFYEGFNSRPSCHNCQFKTMGRISDFTLFDCWHAALFDKSFGINEGSTMVFIHSDKGMEMFDAIRGEFRVVECDCDKAAEYDGVMITISAPAHPFREQFLSDFNSMPMKILIEKYFPYSVKRIFKHYLKHLLYITGIWSLYWKLKHLK